jgi:hypothetical protein
VIGATIAGFVMAMSKRYQVITILNALLLGFGMILMTQMTSTTSLPVIECNMIITGIGLGAFLPVATLAVQNALPRTRLGVGTAAVKYLLALGQMLGLAIVGTVVNSAIASDIVTHLTKKQIQQLTPEEFKHATDPRVLVDITYRNTVVNGIVNLAKMKMVPKAVAQAIKQAHVSPNLQHKAMLDAISQRVSIQVMTQVTHLLYQIFGALKQSLSMAIHHGFVTMLFFCGGILLSALFLKDALLKTYEDIEYNGYKESNFQSDAKQTEIIERQVA